MRVLIHPANDFTAVPVERTWQIAESAAPGSVGHLVNTGEEFLVDGAKSFPYRHLKVWVDPKTYQKLKADPNYGEQPAA